MVDIGLMSARYFALSLLTIGKIGVESIRAESTIFEPDGNGLTNFVAIATKNAHCRSKGVDRSDFSWRTSVCRVVA